MVEVKMNKRKILAHLPNSGRLTTVLTPNVKTFLKKPPVWAGKRKRKSKYDVFAVENCTVTIVDTRFSSFLAEKAIENGLFEALQGYRVASRNFRAEDSLLDLKLIGTHGVFFLEVKSVTHVIGRTALFPDAPTKRGTKHVQLLIRLKKRGYNTGVFFSVQRGDAKVLKLNSKVDPKFSRSLAEAMEIGVKVFVQTSIFKPPNTVAIVPNVPRVEL